VGALWCTEDWAGGKKKKGRATLSHAKNIISDGREREKTDHSRPPHRQTFSVSPSGRNGGLSRRLRSMSVCHVCAIIRCQAKRAASAANGGFRHSKDKTKWPEVFAPKSKVNQLSTSSPSRPTKRSVHLIGTCGSMVHDQRSHE
jgi:hypothetical protein